MLTLTLEAIVLLVLAAAAAYAATAASPRQDLVPARRRVTRPTDRR